MADTPRILALFGARVVFGQERATMDALAALRDEGCEVLCVIRPELWPELMALRELLDARGLAWVTAPHIDYPARGWLIRIALHNPVAYVKGNLAFRRIVTAYRPTHIHAVNAFYVASFYSALRSIPVPMVYRAEDAPIAHNPFWRALWRFIVRRTTLFVANSHYIKGELIRSGVDGARVAVIYAPPPRRMDSAPVAIPKAADGPSVFRFVYVGQLIPEKGIDVMVDAFRSVAATHPNAQLLIAGRISDWSGDDWARDLRDRTQADAAIGGRVHFLGLVEDAPELMRLCHAHLAPSVHEEPYGLVVVEAKSVARPSIIFRSGGMTELVENGVDGAVVEEKTAAALARAMLVYAENPDLAAAHGKAAAGSMARLGFDSFSRQWREVYDRAACEPTP